MAPPHGCAGPVGPNRAPSQSRERCLTRGHRTEGPVRPGSVRYDPVAFLAGGSRTCWFCPRRSARPVVTPDPGRLDSVWRSPSCGFRPSLSAGVLVSTRMLLPALAFFSRRRLSRRRIPAPLAGGATSRSPMPHREPWEANARTCPSRPRVQQRTLWWKAGRVADLRLDPTAGLSIPVRPPLVGDVAGRTLPGASDARLRYDQRTRTARPRARRQSWPRLLEPTSR